MRVVAAKEIDHLLDGKEALDAGALEDDADSSLQGALVELRVVAEDAHLAGVVVAVAFEDLDGRGLAGAVRPEQAEDLAGAHGEVDALEGLEVAVGLAQAAGFDDGGGHEVIVMTGDWEGEIGREAIGGRNVVETPQWIVMLGELRVLSPLRRNILEPIQRGVSTRLSSIIAWQLTEAAANDRVIV